MEGIAIIPLLIVIVIGGGLLVVTESQDKAIMDQPAAVGTVDEVSAVGSYRNKIEIDGKIYLLDVDGEPIPGEGSEVLYRVNGDRVIDIEKVSGSDAADTDGSAESGAAAAEDALAEDLPAKAGTVSDAFTVDKTERYVKIDGNAYLLDESIETVPAKGSKILYRVDAGRIVEIKRADGAGASE